MDLRHVLPEADLAGIAPTGGYPMRSQFLGLQATVIGMHYLVFDLLKARGGGRHLAWSRFLGRAVETYGRRLLREYLTDPVLSFPDLDQAQEAHRPKACDFYIDDGLSVVAGDFVHRNLTLATQTTGDTDQLDRDLTLGVVEKIDQIEATLIAKEPVAERIYPLVVMSGPMLMNPAIEAHLEVMISQKERAYVGSDTRCRPASVIELHELRQLLATASDNNLTVSDLLEMWKESAMGANNFRDWLTTQTSVSPTIATAGEPWEAIVERMFSADIPPNPSVSGPSAD